MATDHSVVVRSLTNSTGCPFYLYRCCNLFIVWHYNHLSRGVCLVDEASRYVWSLSFISSCLTHILPFLVPHQCLGLLTWGPTCQVPIPSSLVYRVYLFPPLLLLCMVVLVLSWDMGRLIHCPWFYLMEIMWPTSQSYFHLSFIFIQMNFYLLSFLCEVSNEVHRRMQWLSELWWDNNTMIIGY